MESPIELFLTITGDYMKYAAVTILSILENVSRRVNIRMLCTEASDEDKGIVSSMVGKFNASVEFLIISDMLWELLRGTKINQFSRLGKPIGYVRFLIPYICRTKKALYMDTDTIVVGDIAPLWNTGFIRDGKERAFAAAKGDAWKEGNLQIGLPEDYPHINNGIVLFNCVKWCEDKMLDQLMDIAKRTHYDLIAHDDQCTINIWGNQNEGPAEFGYEYNALVNGWIPENFKILHYLGTRPWIDPYCRYAYKWWNVARRTAYYERFLMEMLHKQE